MVQCTTVHVVQCAAVVHCTIQHTIVVLLLLDCVGELCLLYRLELFVFTVIIIIVLILLQMVQCTTVYYAAGMVHCII